MGTLYEYRESYKYALMMLGTNEEAQVVNEDGELVNVKDFINSLEGDIHEKVEGTILFTKELESDINGIKQEIDTLRKRLATKQNLFDRLRGGVAETMLELGEMKYETPKMALSFRKSESVKIVDEFAIPQQYIKRKVEDVPDKTEIKKAIKAGEIVSGAELEVKHNLQVK